MVPEGANDSTVSSRLVGVCGLIRPPDTRWEGRAGTSSSARPVDDGGGNDDGASSASSSSASSVTGAAAAATGWARLRTLDGREGRALVVRLLVVGAAVVVVVDGYNERMN